ncbi:MAG TPA: hypothetical protein VE988_17340 [Gemmataceae bacterium]|nr:hypothetical protein [Gemmataceae bacterium]
MKFFTRDRYLALQNPHEDAMDAADADWEAAVNAYDAQLRLIRPAMPPTVRQLLDGLYLHDARVLSMGQCGETFTITLQLDVPPNDLLTIAYSLAGQPQVIKEAFPWVHNADIAKWLYDEMELNENGNGKQYIHAILLSNGWEINLPLKDVQLTTAVPILPAQATKTNRSVLPAVKSA